MIIQSVLCCVDSERWDDVESQKSINTGTGDILWEMEKLDTIFQSVVLMMYLQVERILQLQETKAKKLLSLTCKSIF